MPVGDVFCYPVKVIEDFSEVGSAFTTNSNVIGNEQGNVGSHD